LDYFKNCWYKKVYRAEACYISQKRQVFNFVRPLETKGGLFTGKLSESKEQEKKNGVEV